MFLYQSSRIALRHFNSIPVVTILSSIQQRLFSITPNLAMASENPENPQTVYDFIVKDTYGNDVPLEKYKGKALMIVNIASQCGLTKTNYEQLTQLEEQYKDKDFKILSFPCNQFASEMPEKDGEEMVCHLQKANAKVGDVFKKVDVNGDNAAPLFKFLKKKQGGFMSDGIKWNFTKFLVDKNGVPVERFAPTTTPSSIAKKVDALLQ